MPAWPPVSRWGTFETASNGLHKNNAPAAVSPSATGASFPRVLSSARASILLHERYGEACVVFIGEIGGISYIIRYRLSVAGSCVDQWADVLSNVPTHYLLPRCRIELRVGGRSIERPQGSLSNPAIPPIENPKPKIQNRLTPDSFPPRSHAAPFSPRGFPEDEGSWMPFGPSAAGRKERLSCDRDLLAGDASVHPGDAAVGARRERDGVDREGPLTRFARSLEEEHAPATEHVVELDSEVS